MEVVLRRMPTGQTLGGWPSQFYKLIVAGELAVEWAEKSGKLIVRKVADAYGDREVELGESYASLGASTCYSVEAGSEALVVVRRWSACGLGKSGWMWAVVDLDKRKVVWRTTGREQGSVSPDAGLRSRTTHDDPQILQATKRAMGARGSGHL